MHVGQLAKIHGLKVIGITGSDSKCKWVVDELGYDHAINYKTQNVAEALKEAAPKGFDCYFDNVCVYTPYACDSLIKNNIFFSLIHAGRR